MTNYYEEITPEVKEILSFWDLQDLAKKRKNFIPPEPKPTFHLLQFIKEFRITFEYKGFKMQVFDQINRPKYCRFIYSIQKHKYAGYVIRAKSSATTEQIENEIEDLILPY